LLASKAPHRIQLGIHLTEGLGAGSKPEVGEAAAQEAEEELKSRITGAHMLFIAAGMGGGTGTGAAAVIARIARDLGVLTVAVVTRPFQFEGTRRMRIADAGIAELKHHVDTLIVIPNQNLFNIANERTTFAEAFVLADQVLFSGIACIVDLIVKDGLINLDLADVRTVLTGMGPAVMGTGEASGERRAVIAAEEAITNQLLDNMKLTGAKGLLLSIIGGRDLTLFEVDEAASRVRLEVDPEANIIVGAAFDEAMGDRVRVSIVASGMPEVAGHVPQPDRRPATSARPAVPVPAAAAPNSAPTLPGTFSPAAPAARTSATPPPLPGHGAAGATTLPAKSLAQPRQDDSAQNVWIGPEDVGVRSHSAPAVERSTTVRPPVAAKANESAYATRHEPFAPQPPMDTRRSHPRAPEISDFPPIGQKEYLAKSAQLLTAATTPNRPHAGSEISRPEPKKGSLFQRLADVARGKPRDPASEATVPNDQPLPDFFAKEKRRN
jgi:cell division protein FtsZ